MFEWILDFPSAFPSLFPPSFSTSVPLKDQDIFSVQSRVSPTAEVHRILPDDGLSYPQEKNQTLQNGGSFVPALTEVR